MLQLSKKKSEYYDASSLVKQKDLKAPPNHIKTVLDGIQLFNWPQFDMSGQLIDHLKETND